MALIGTDEPPRPDQHSALAGNSRCEPKMRGAFELLSPTMGKEPVARRGCYKNMRQTCKATDRETAGGKKE
jgi:hypothetical protein